MPKLFLSLSLSHENGTVPFAPDIVTRSVSEEEARSPESLAYASGCDVRSLAYASGCDVRSLAYASGYDVRRKDLP